MVENLSAIWVSTYLIYSLKAEMSYNFTLLGWICLLLQIVNSQRAGTLTVTSFLSPPSGALGCLSFTWAIPSKLGKPSPLKTAAMSKEASLLVSS